MKNGLIHISFSHIDFECPYCGKKYRDDNDEYINRCNKNKSGCTSIKCECERRFGMTYDMTGTTRSYKLEK